MAIKLLPPVRAWLQRNSLRITLFLLTFLFIIVYLAPNIFISVPAGHAGVLWKRFYGGTITTDWENGTGSEKRQAPVSAPGFIHGGTTQNRVYTAGMHIIFPWNIMHVYDVRMQQITDTFYALSSDGLPIDVEMTVRFRLNEPDIGVLHQHVGPDYIQTLLVPEVGAHLREQVAKFEPDELYSGKRVQIQNEILSRMQDGVSVRYQSNLQPESFIHVEDTLIRNIILPQRVRLAIQNKLAQKHLMLEYDYRVQKERKEADRKEIEASGIARFQEIVNQGISEAYLKWKGIDATLTLAQSNNSKVVIIGSGKHGMPIILGNMDTVPGSSPGLPAPDLRTFPPDYPNFDIDTAP